MADIIYLFRVTSHCDNESYGEQTGFSEKKHPPPFASREGLANISRVVTRNWSSQSMPSSSFF